MQWADPLEPAVFGALLGPAVDAFAGGADVDERHRVRAGQRWGVRGPFAEEPAAHGLELKGVVVGESAQEGARCGRGTGPANTVGVAPWRRAWRLPQPPHRSPRRSASPSGAPAGTGHTARPAASPGSARCTRSDSGRRTQRRPSPEYSHHGTGRWMGPEPWDRDRPVAWLVWAVISARWRPRSSRACGHRGRARWGSAAGRTGPLAHRPPAAVPGDGRGYGGSPWRPRSRRGGRGPGAAGGCRTWRRG